MTELELVSDLGNLKKYRTLPVDYKIYEIGHKIGVSLKDLDFNTDGTVDTAGVTYYAVTNRKPIATDTREVATASLPTAGASRNLATDTNWDKWLEPSENTMYKVLVGFSTDRYAEWEVKYPKSNTLGGTQQTPNPRFTSDDSDIFEPRLPITTMKNNYPVFVIYNQSQYTMAFAKVGVIGYKYSLQKLNYKPQTADYEVLNDVADIG